jgi:hypothetical protein
MKDDDLIYDTLLTWRGGFGNIVAKIKMQCWQGILATLATTEPNLTEQRYGSKDPEVM